MYLWPPVWWKDLSRVVNKGVSDVCICSKSKLFWHSGSPTTWIFVWGKKRLELVVFEKPGGENGESASCLLPLWCRPIADVVVQEHRGWRSLDLWWKERGRKIAAQHDSTSGFLCLSPLIMYFLLAAGGGGTLRERRARGPARRSHLSKEHKQRVRWQKQWYVREKSTLSRDSLLTAAGSFWNGATRCSGL